MSLKPARDTIAAESSSPTTAPANNVLRRRYPAERSLRVELRRHAEAAAANLANEGALAKEDLAAAARGVLHDLGHGEEYLGWTTVAVAASYWRSAAAGTPYDRRILFLPSTAPGTATNGEAHAINERMAHLRRLARGLGYRVVLTDDRDEAIRAATSGPVGAVFGAAELDVLEKAFDLLAPLELPALAVPLPREGHDLDLDWLEEFVRTPYAEDAVASGRFAATLTAAQTLSDEAEWARLSPSFAGAAERSAEEPTDASGPLGAAHRISCDFLAGGGKHFRPFITLAVYDAMRSGGAASPQDRPEFPSAVKRLAFAIETFHKASLVHDDIEDDDDFRYGRPTVHVRHGVATAINVGDYLIGLGYRLITECREELGADAVADVTARLADAHLRLARGQGAEIAWRDAAEKNLLPDEAIEIYALKTAPAFEAAFYAGLRAAGPCNDADEEFVAAFAGGLGVAFQILNDLKDWSEDAANKMTAGGDVLGARPTLLWALALERLPEDDAQRLRRLAAGGAAPAEEIVEEVRRLYVQADVFPAAAERLEAHRRAGERLVQNAPGPLQPLCRFLLQAVLCDAEIAWPTAAV